jgi:hypothetical protein
MRIFRGRSGTRPQLAPQVAESAVINVPDQIRGEEVKAHIV